MDAVLTVTLSVKAKTYFSIPDFATVLIQGWAVTLAHEVSGWSF